MSREEDGLKALELLTEWIEWFGDERDFEMNPWYSEAWVENFRFRRQRLYEDTLEIVRRERKRRQEGDQPD